MKRKILLLLFSVLILLFTASCTIPLIGDLYESESSLGKTNNTAVAIAGAMEDYLAAKKKSDLRLYGVELVLNSDGNGTVKLFYSGVLPEKAAYSDIYVAQVDSKTGHVERFGKADYAKDGIKPYQSVKDGYPMNAADLPIDSNKAISNGAKQFSTDLDFYYDFIQIDLMQAGGAECYELAFISMLNDKIYYCTVDAVSGSVLASSVGAL